jgi:uncharacterized membrane protein
MLLMALALYGVILAGLAIGLLEGSEIAMLTVAAASRYKWRKAWKVTIAGLATLVPLLLVLYIFFTSLPLGITYLLAGAVIFVLGAHFFLEGLEKRNGGEDEEEDEKKLAKAGLIGVYTAILLEEVEAGSITISIGAAAGGAYLFAVLGTIIGLILPLIAIKGLEPLIEKLPEWMIQLTLGAVMMVVAVLIVAYHF